MKRDHKLIWGGGLCGNAGFFLGVGVWALGAALLVIGVLLIANAGEE